MNNWSSTPSTAWQKQQNKLNAHILQTAAWGAFQEAKGRKVLYAHGETWSWLAIVESGRFGTRLFCPAGPTASTKTGLQTALDTLVACAKANHVTYIRVEPQSPYSTAELPQIGLKPAHRNIHPRFTQVKDLTRSEDELLAEMSATNRNLYRTAGKKGLSFRQSTNPSEVTIFVDMMREVAGRNQITIHHDEYYQTMVATLMPLGALQLYIAEHENQPVAASIVLDSTHTRYYAHAASRAAARKLHPGTPLLTHMIFDAKKRGLKAFDFFGIAPPDQPNHPWRGFTQFKQSFGGQPVDMHGTWELPVKKFSYALYRAAAQLAG